MNILFLAAAIAVRNPFWPIGYEGTREIISPEPIIEVKAATQADEESETTTAAEASKALVVTGAATNKHWIDARKSLKIGGTAVVTQPDGAQRQCVMINGLAYADGDLISANHNGRRFTWRVQGLTKGATLKLTRIRARKTEDD